MRRQHICSLCILTSRAKGDDDVEPDRNFISRSVEIRGTSNRGARSLATRWKMSLRGRTDDDDRFCRRSLLLFLIFLWWPYVPLPYHFLSLVILVLHIFSPSLFFSFSLLLLLLNFLFHRECKPLSGRCSRNCLQSDGIEQKDDLIPRQTKGIQESKRQSRNDYLLLLATLAHKIIRWKFCFACIPSSHVFIYLLSSDNREKITYFDKIKSDSFLIVGMSYLKSII